MKTPFGTDVVEKISRAVESVDAQRQPVSATLDHAASALHHQTDRVAEAAHGTADRLQATADYVRKNDLNAMSQSALDIVRRYPVPALLAAAVGGFLVARLIRSRSTGTRPDATAGVAR